MIQQTSFIHSFVCAVTDDRLSNSIFTVHKLVAKPSAVAKEITVHFTVVPVGNAAQFSITFAGNNVASKTAMLANRRSGSKIPFTGIMFFKRFISKNSCMTNLGQVTTKRALQYAIFFSSKINMMMCRKNIQVITTGIVTVKTYTPITLYAPVHFVMNKRPQILIVISAFLVVEATVIVARHHRHVLQMTTAAFITYRAIMRMIGHQPFNYLFTKGFGSWMINRYTQSIFYCFHA